MSVQLIPYPLSGHQYTSFDRTLTDALRDEKAELFVSGPMVLCTIFCLVETLCEGSISDRNEEIAWNLCAWEEPKS